MSFNIGQVANGRRLEGWELERFRDLLARRRGIYLDDKQINDPDLYLVGPRKSKMLGEDWPIIQSKTIWRKKELVEQGSI